MLSNLDWGVQNGPITKNGVFASSYFMVLKFFFSVRTSYKELNWCTNHPDVHIHTFRKRWHFIWRCFFPASILKKTLDESNFHHCHDNFLESVILKVTFSQLYSKFLLNNSEAHDNKILIDTLQLKILRTWIEIRTNSFIKTWINMKRKSRRSLENYQFWKNTIQHSKEHCTKIDDISLIVIRFFFLLNFQTNLILYLNQC